jgi:hypothetical protein
VPSSAAAASPRRPGVASARRQSRIDNVPPAEPALAARPSPLFRDLLAARPASLDVSLIAARVGVAKAPPADVAIGVLACLWVVGAVLAGALPKLAIASLATVPMTLGTARPLLAHAAQPANRVGAIERTLGAANVHGLAMTPARALSR